jgi:ATP-dependent exoDNAse (exonuclease V) beta subunit
MTTKSLKIISASAGSGKTHRLTNNLLKEIKSHRLDPNKLIAVTFTEAGASELKTRIRSVLLKEGLFEQAQKVEDAYISTIHAFGNRLLRESAFDLGLPLNTRMLNEDEQTQLIRSSMIDSPALAKISENLEEFGFKTTRKGLRYVSAEASFRSQLKFFIDLLRSTGRQQVDTEFLSRSVQWLEKSYGPLELNRTEEDLARVMHRKVKDLLQEYPHCPVDQFGVIAASAAADYRESYRALDKAQKFYPLLSDWALWAKLANLKVGFKGSAKATGFKRYEELALALVGTANELLMAHPGPLRQARDQLASMINGASETLSGYSRRKNEAKLMDYTDMVASAEKALQNPGVRNRFLAAIQTVMVDEFQDTNPIQFAFLWHLIGAGLDTTLVGDVKQSIMGFQGADPRLFKALLDLPEADVSSLDKNWRSQPALLDVINALTHGLCSPAGMNAVYQSLGTESKSEGLNPLHVVVIKDKPTSNRKKKDEDADGRIHPTERVWNASQIAKVIKAKIESGHQVLDRHTGLHRALRGSDIAVLCPTNSLLAIYAKQLETLGLTVNIERQDWFDTAEVQLGLQLLCLLANPEDKHAKLMLACSDLGKMSLQEALEAELNDRSISLPVFETLNSLRLELVGLEITDIVQSVLERTGLLLTVSSWADGSQARANLLKLIGLAQEFSQAQPETLASAGFYGRGIETFVGWLHFLKKERNEDSCPRANYNDVEAVELTTWHKSKGREWPIVVVCGMNKSPKADLPKAEIGYLDFSDLSSLIGNSRIEFTPRYDLEAKREALAAPLRQEAEQIAMRELYVALSRPREQLVLEWLPSHLNSKDVKVKKRIQILQDLCDIKVEPGEVTILGKKFAALVDEMSYSWSHPTESLNPNTVPKPSFGRLALDLNSISTSRVPAQVNPSLIEQSLLNLNAKPANFSSFEISQINDVIDLGKQERANELGTLVHRLIELVISGKDNIQVCSDIITNALSKFIPKEAVDSLWKHARKLKFELAGANGNLTLGAEVPVLGTLDGKTVVVGSVDLLVSDQVGGKIIDHKTDSKLDDLDAVWSAHRTQLSVYAGLLPGHSVSLNLIRSGQLLSSKG